MLLGIFGMVLICAISWILTCGLYYLVTLCFGWTFSWAIATGVWLLWMVAKSLFSVKVVTKK